MPPVDKLLNNEYRMRINRIIDYIQAHYAEDLSLEKLASIACFSKFHFHRLFRAMVGETLNDYVQRIRLEKSVRKLTSDRTKSITDIAFECGFSGSQNFARLFKSHYGVTPSVIRREYHWDEWKNKMRRLKGRELEELPPAEAHLYDIYRNKRKLSIDKILDERPVTQVKIVDMPDLRVAYVRSIGPYTTERLLPAFNQLTKWAAPRGLMNDDAKILGVWNNPGSVPEDKLIHDACITVPDSVSADKWVDVQILPGGKYAIHHLAIRADQMEATWLSFVLNWLTFSDYQPDDRPMYQIYYKAPENDPSRLRVLDLCMPVKPFFE